LIEITKPSHSGRLFDGKKYETERTDRLPELMTWKIRIEQNSAFGCFFHSIKGGKHVTVFFLEIAVRCADEAHLLEILGVVANDIVDVAFHHIGRQTVAGGIQMAAHIETAAEIGIVDRCVGIEIEKICVGEYITQLYKYISVASYALVVSSGTGHTDEKEFGIGLYRLVSLDNIGVISYE
jgi:hypothetical protein